MFPNAGIPTVPPRLAPIIFTGGTRAGQRAQAICSLDEGDQPITMQWLKDGIQLLESDNNLHISKVNDFTSMLVINRTVEEHSGNYTCSASNSARTATTSTRLSISGMIYTYSHKNIAQNKQYCVAQRGYIEIKS